MSDDMLLEAAREALARPGSFLYYGNTPLFESWGLTLVKSRDSGVVEESNFERVTEDLDAFIVSFDDDPAEYVEIIRCSHFAFGWVEHLAVRVLIDDDGAVEPWNITGAFRWVTSVALKLRDHMVYDEDDVSERESAEQWDAFLPVWAWFVELNPEDKHRDPRDVLRHITEHDCETRTYFGDDVIADAVWELAWDEARDEYTHTYRFQLTLDDWERELLGDA